VASSIHSNFLTDRHAVFNQIYTHTTTGSLLLGSSDDCNYVLNEFFDDRAYLDPRKIDVEEYLPLYDDVFLLDVSYSTVDYTSDRGKVVARERETIREFIDSHDTELLFETTSPHSVKIYKLNQQVS